MSSGSVNKVFLIGNLGADPELRYSSASTPVCNFRLATNQRWTDKDGLKQERTEWHRVVVWGRLAETVAEYMSKGRQVCVQGHLQTRKWEDSEGNTRYNTEVVAEEVTFLAGGKRTQSTGQETHVDEDPVIDEEAARVMG